VKDEMMKEELLGAIPSHAIAFRSFLVRLQNILYN
jgi:hypothetical protein